VPDTKHVDVGNNRGMKAVELNLKPKDLIGIPWRVAFALQTAGWYLRQDIIWHKPNPMPESVKDRCTKAHEYIFLFSKNQRYYYDNEAIKEPVKQETIERERYGWKGAYKGQFIGTPGEKRYQNGKPIRPKGPQKGYKRPNKEAASVGPMARGKEGFNHQFADPERVWDDGKTRNKRSVWTVSTKPFSGAHFATFPPDLILPCILAGCPEGGTVLDPFFGSGTTGIVAYQQDRKFIGIELSEKYLSEIVIPRIKKETEQLKLFSVC
jgi:DNA modification methylase